MFPALAALGGAGGGIGGLLASIFSMQGANNTPDPSKDDPEYEKKMLAQKQGKQGAQRNMIGTIAQLGLNSVNKIGNSIQDMVASRSDNPYPHAMNLRARSRGRQDILDENQARRDQQSQLQQTGIAANQQASAEERGWRSGEADKSRTLQRDMFDASAQDRLGYALAQAGQVPPGAGSGSPQEMLAKAMAPRWQQETQAGALSNQRQALALQQAQQAPVQAAADSRRQLATQIAGMGMDPSGPWTEEGLLSRLSREMARRNQLNEQAGQAKGQRDASMTDARLKQMQAQQAAKEAEAEWLRRQGAGGGQPGGQTGGWWNGLPGVSAR